MEQELLQKLTRLDELIQQERGYARSLRITELKELPEQKGLLLNELQSLAPDCPPELKQIASRIREENRRNAQLLYTSLNYLREAMRSCTRQLTPVSYGSRGHRQQTAPAGLLLTGRI